MWKRFYLVTLILCGPVLSKFSPEYVIDKILDRLESTLEYISEHYDKINVDCLFGVVLGKAFLDDTASSPGPYQEKAKVLGAKSKEIYKKSLPVMAKNPQWNSFARYIVVPDLWKKPMHYKLAEFRMVYARKSKLEALITPSENFNEGFSDHCLSLVVNSTLTFKPKALCRLSPKCEKFVESLDSGSGYMTTHKLLLLQVARARRCKMNPKILANAIKKACTTIYAETVSLDFFVGLEEFLDLFMEQTLLCGYEGYADFLKIPWLETIFKSQHDSGCFPASGHRRIKREGHVWKDGCMDHTTGLGAGALSLYLNYLIKNAQTIVITSEWF